MRRADEDGKAATEDNIDWVSLDPQPPHPEYPSGHSSASSALASTLGLVFGDDPGDQIVVQTSGITRTWDTYSQGIAEVVDARVLAGIHFRNSDEVGARMGMQVARFVSTHALRPCPRGGGRCR